MKCRCSLGPLSSVEAYLVEIRPASPAPSWIPVFLDLLRTHRGHLAAALKAAAPGTIPSRTSLYRHRQRNAAFRARWDAIVQSFPRRRR